MAAPTLAAYGFVTGTGASQTTASLSWQTNDVIVLMAGTEGGDSETWSTPTTTGSGLTIAQQQLHSSVATNCGGGVYAAVASASSSGTFTVSNPDKANPTGTHVAVGAFVCRGSAGIGNSGVAASSSRTLSLIPTGADGLIIWGVFDWSAAAVVAATPTATTHSTASPGPSASPQAAAVGTSYSYYIEELDDQVSSGAVSYGVTGTGTGPFTILAIEVKASAGGAAAPNPRVPRMSPVPIIRAANF